MVVHTDNKHAIISTMGAIILGPQALNGSHAQHAINVAMNKASFLPDWYQAKPIVTYNNGHTTPNTQLGGASGIRVSTLLIRPHIDDDMDAVEIINPGAMKRNTIFYMIKLDVIDVLRDICNSLMVILVDIKLMWFY